MTAFRHSTVTKAFAGLLLLCLLAAPAALAKKTKIPEDLPERYKVADLTPLDIGSLEELAATFAIIDPSGLAIARLPIRVAK